MKRATTLINAENRTKIRFLSVVAIVAGLSGSAAFALDPMGPPAARVREGRFSVGFDFSHSETDIELSNGRWVENDAGVIEDAGQAVDLTIKDFEVNKLYGSVGYGIMENWEAFLQVGATAAEFGDSIWNDTEDFESNSQFGIGGGVRATFYEAIKFKIGGLFQVNWSEFDGKLDATPWPAPDSLDVNLTQMQIAIGVSYMLRDWVWVYGGPFAHYIKGDLEDIYTDYEFTWDIDEGPIYGGFVGAEMKVARDLFFNVEYQHSSDANAFGAGLMFRF